MDNKSAIFIGCALLGLLACRPKKKTVINDLKIAPAHSKEVICCESNLLARFTALSGQNGSAIKGRFRSAPENMVFIKAGTFFMGADNDQAASDEYPKHKVIVDSFWMDLTEVTNAQFARFVKATGYKTTAELKPDWSELKKQLPPGSSKPADSLLVAAALVFDPPKHAVPLNEYTQWWSWKKGACWKHPQGPESNIRGKDNYPVVQVSWFDAMAYCRWANKRLPTEAEWEWAARGGLNNKIYPWGNESINEGRPRANTWQGHFPDHNTLKDRYYRLAPVRSFAANGYGLYDMAGNAWEWCSDYYSNNYYKLINATAGSKNPRGPQKSYDPDDPYAQKRVIRGGSFLCNDAYCSGYRVARRMKSTEDSSMEHVGFRCVQDVDNSK